MKKLLVVSMFLAVSANAAMKIDDGSSANKFVVDGKEVSAAEATLDAQQGKQVFKCRDKAATKGKLFFDKSGKIVSTLNECTLQELVINGRTGGIKFKAVK